MNYLLPILAVLLSFGFVFVTKPTRKESFKLLLAFSGAFLLAITLFELFPSIYQHNDVKSMGLFVMLGILLQTLLESFSKGAEHGHVHLNGEDGVFPWLLFVSLSVHALLEGLPIEQHHNMIYGILVHKVPIAIILSIFLLNSKMNLYKAVLFIILFSVMTPLGTLLAAKIPFVLKYATQITALVIGVLLHISTVILFESTEGHKFNLRKSMAIVLGILIAYFL